MGMEGMGFNAELYINGIKCCHVLDDASGGCYDIQPYTYENPNAVLIIKNIELLNKYLKSLPIEPMMIDGEHMKDINGELCYHDNDMESYIYKLFAKHLDEKANKKFLNHCKKYICIGVPNSDSYTTIKFVKPILEYDKRTIQVIVDNVKAKEIKGSKVKGIKILNENLIELGINI